MIAIEPPIGGFTTWSAEGHGHDFTGASTSERVRGRVRREMLVAILPRARLASVLDELRRGAAIAHMAYWVEPVEGFGRMTLEAAAAAGAAIPPPIPVAPRP